MDKVSPQRECNSAQGLKKPASANAAAPDKSPPKNSESVISAEIVPKANDDKIELSNSTINTPQMTTGTKPAEDVAKIKSQFDGFEKQELVDFLQANNIRIVRPTFASKDYLIQLCQDLLDNPTKYHVTKEKPSKEIEPIFEDDQYEQTTKDQLSEEKKSRSAKQKQTTSVEASVATTQFESAKYKTRPGTHVGIERSDKDELYRTAKNNQTKSIHNSSETRPNKTPIKNQTVAKAERKGKEPVICLEEQFVESFDLESGVEQRPAAPKNNQDDDHDLSNSDSSPLFQASSDLEACVGSQKPITNLKSESSRQVQKKNEVVQVDECENKDEDEDNGEDNGQNNGQDNDQDNGEDEGEFDNDEVKEVQKKEDDDHDSRSSMSSSLLSGEVDDEEINVAWRRPNYLEAKRVEAMVRPHRPGKKKEQYRWRSVNTGKHGIFGCCENNVSELAAFGSGITNYFKFVKWCCSVMFILSILHLPMIVINTFGAALQYDTVSVAATTLGNLGTAANITEIILPGCDYVDLDIDIVPDNCKMSKSRLAIYFSLLDAAGTLIVIISWLWLRTSAGSEIAIARRSCITATDYTICVPNLPYGTTEDHIVKHFAALTGEKIAQVHLAFDNEIEIKKYMQRGALVKQRYDCLQQIRYEMTLGREKGPKKMDKRKLNRLMNQRDQLTDHIRRADVERVAVSSAPIPIQAFVTFDTEAGLFKTLSAYQLRWVQTFFLCYPRRLMLRGRQINVRRAPEPSTILWENLAVSDGNRMPRKALTTSVAIIVMLLSVVVTFLSKDFQQATLKKMDAECPSYFADLSEDEKLRFIMNDSGVTHCYCSALAVVDQSRNSLCEQFLKDTAKSQAMSFGASFIVVGINFFFSFLMERSGNFEKHHSLDGKEESIMVRIFFLRFINTGCLVLLYNQGWLQHLVGVRIEDDTAFSVEWHGTGGKSMLVVMCINMLAPHMSVIWNYMNYRRAISAVERQLDTNQQLRLSPQVWYSQDALNEIFIGPEFTLNYRLSQTLLTFFVCWMYSTSMPLMPFIGMLSFFVQYWVDKFMFCNYYRTPPRYSDNIGNASSNLIGFAVVVHLICSIWALGSGNIFQRNLLDFSDAFSQTKEGIEGSYNSSDWAKLPPFVRQRHVIVLELILITYILVGLLNVISSHWYENLKKFCRCILCMRGSKDEKLFSQMNLVPITYTKAIKKGSIKGQPTYNILQNPKYQEAFGISKEFASNHKLLCSIRGFNTKEGTLS